MLLDLDEQSKSLKSTQYANNCGTYNLACEYYCKYVDVQALLFSKFLQSYMKLMSIAYYIWKFF
jgi:hypothetical protein